MQIVLEERDFAQGYPVLLHFPNLTNDGYEAFCQRNPDFNIERNRQGEILLSLLSGGERGKRNAALSACLHRWTMDSDAGVAFASSAQFCLPLGARYSPSASWMRKERWDSLTPEVKEGFPPLCPDVIVELTSPSASAEYLNDKMGEYSENGMILGWLIDPQNRRVYVYRPGQESEILENPASVSAEPQLPGFVLKTARIFG